MDAHADDRRRRAAAADDGRRDASRTNEGGGRSVIVARLSCLFAFFMTHALPTLWLTFHWQRVTAADCRSFVWRRVSWFMVFAARCVLDLSASIDTGKLLRNNSSKLINIQAAKDRSLVTYLHYASVHAAFVTNIHHLTLAMSVVLWQLNYYLSFLQLAFSASHYYSFCKVFCYGFWLADNALYLSTWQTLSPQEKLRKTIYYFTGKYY